MPSRIPGKAARPHFPTKERQSNSTANAGTPAAWFEDHNPYAAIVEHSNDAIFSRTLKGTITTWNAAAERIFGYRADEIIRRSSRVLQPRGRSDEFRQLIARIRRGEVIQHYETERLRKDGRRIHLSLTLSPIRGPGGRLFGFSTIARDITEQRRVREALERREHELADLFEGVSVGWLLTTGTGRILRANEALLKVLECKAEGCIGKALGRFHPDRNLMSELLKRLAGHETLHNFQMALRPKAGQIKEVLVDASALWEHGKLVHIRWFIRDISKRKQLEREVLAIAERERCAFARELHDGLGQQLSGIAYLSNVVRDRLREAGSTETAEVARIAKLLKQAIEETRRLAHGLSPIQPEPDGLGIALGELATQVRSVFGIECRFNCQEPVWFDGGEAANHLYRIAQEAVHNAIRHGHARRIIIRLRRTGRQVTLSIADNGRGLPVLSSKRKGLGLRVMQYRADLLQGSLAVLRRAGGGTLVRCTVPFPA
jgi:PAS domain S-box-containing protein